MVGLDQMSEPVLLAELHRVSAACERLDQEARHAAQRQRFRSGAQEIAQAARDERTLLADLSRLMDFRRAVEGYLMVG